MPKRGLRGLLMAGLAAIGVSLTGCAAGYDMAAQYAAASGVPQMPAFLPMKYSVPETQALPIDGVWQISTIGKKIRIEKGRAYAVDPWLHLFTLKIQPDMVVSQNYQRTGPGQYRADDLPLMGPSTLQLRPDGNLSVVVKGAMGPAAFALIKMSTDDPSAFSSELAMVGGSAPITSPYPAPDPGYGDDEQGAPSSDFDDCDDLQVNPDTGQIYCAD